MNRINLPDRLTADRTVLVVIDIQEKFRDIIHGMDTVMANTGRLIKFSQHLDIPMVATEHYPRGLGVTVPEIRNLCSPFTPIEKINFSCAGCAPFNIPICLGRFHLGHHLGFPFGCIRLCPVHVFA